MNCDCHGQPMEWNKDKRCRAGGFWRCHIQRLEWGRKYWSELNGVAYNKRLLQMRRACAMHRHRNRKESFG